MKDEALHQSVWISGEPISPELQELLRETGELMPGGYVLLGIDAGFGSFHTCEYTGPRETLNRARDHFAGSHMSSGSPL